MRLSKRDIDFIRNDTELTVKEMALIIGCSVRTVVGYRKGRVGNSNGSGSHRRSEILRRRIRKEVMNYIENNPRASCNDISSACHHDTATIRSIYMSLRRDGLV